MLEYHAIFKKAHNINLSITLAEENFFIKQEWKLIFLKRNLGNTNLS
jgi:hypothetical protein